MLFKYTLSVFFQDYDFVRAALPAPSQSHLTQVQFVKSPTLFFQSFALRPFFHSIFFQSSLHQSRAQRRNSSSRTLQQPYRLSFILSPSRERRHVCH